MQPPSPTQRTLDYHRPAVVNASARRAAFVRVVAGGMGLANVLMSLALIVVAVTDNGLALFVSIPFGLLSLAYLWPSLGQPSLNSRRVIWWPLLIVQGHFALWCFNEGNSIGWDGKEFFWAGWWGINALACLVCGVAELPAA
jgi:hypothetical protein